MTEDTILRKAIPLEDLISILPQIGLYRYSYASFQHSEKAKPVLEFFHKHKANLK